MKMVQHVFYFSGFLATRMEGKGSMTFCGKERTEERFSIDPDQRKSLYQNINQVGPDKYGCRSPM